MSICIQFFYHINISLVDDILIFILATYMVILTIKGQSTSQFKIGLFTIIILFSGFALRICGFFMSAIIYEESTHYFLIITMVRTFILFFMTPFNCNQSEPVIIYY